MKVNFDQELRFLNGKKLRIKEGEKETILTLKMVCIEALLQSDPTDQEARAPGKAMAAYNLAMVINKGGEQEVSSEDVTMLKGRIEKQYAPLVTGQAWDMLEGKESQIKAADDDADDAGEVNEPDSTVNQVE